jgi:uncharacterized RmlC-like cupin family protein
VECRVYRRGERYDGAQGMTYFEGLSGAGICMVELEFPPGGRSRAHLHRGVESAGYVVEGELLMLWGSRLEHEDRIYAGELAYIPPDVPHLALNPTAAVTRAVVAHTAASDQEGIELLPELEEALQARTAGPGSAG